MGTLSDDHFAVGYADALRGADRYAFQDAVYQARYDRGYTLGELEVFQRAETAVRAAQSPFAAWTPRR